MPSSILVSGDFILDQHIYEGRRYHFGDGTSPGARVLPQIGGAALVCDLLAQLLPKDTSTKPADWTCQLAVTPPAHSSIPESQHAYAVWRPYPRSVPAEKRFWLVSDALGFGAPTAKGGAAWPPAVPFPKDAKVIALSEGGMGFRDDATAWSDLPFDSAQWILLKATAEVTSSALWQEIQHFRDRLIVILSAYELRRSSVQISGGLSWDRTVQDLVRELGEGGALAELTKCRCLIVAFESEGALCFEFPEQTKTPTRAHFVFDASAIEGDHSHEADGKAFGFLTCLTAAVAWQTSLNVKQPDFANALEGGLSAMRNLCEKGHGPAYEKTTGFPAERLAKAISHPPYRYSRATFRIADWKNADLLPTMKAANGGKPGPAWSILSASQRPADEPACDLARLVALRGPVALHNLPHLQVGKLITVDRREIESLRTLIQVMRQYKSNESADKPLSIGVFGPPGAGKSFAVKELAVKMVGKPSWIVFNLSQFAGPADLIGAFHQIRDLVLQKVLPVAFFDEFDSQNYRWLQFLLAPMQDGSFQEGQQTHPIGKCILIFAGGTSSSFESFGPKKPADGEEESEAYAAFRLAKGPDFKSRLDAYLDVCGPNIRQLEPTKSARHEDDPDDICFPVRRALMIRSGLDCAEEEKLKIDEGLLYALLHTPNYVHGSRSLTKILQPLKSAGRGQLVRSFLPPRSQLDMQTDAEEFLALCSSPPPRYVAVGTLRDKDIEQLAPMIHETWNQLGLRAGWLQAKDRKEFDELTDFLKDSNRAAARRMGSILALVGLGLESGTASDDEEREINEYIESHLELLAEAEHEEWMNWHLAQGWHYGEKKDEDNHLHPSLLPFSQLREVDRNKDRTSIRQYPTYARLAKRKLVFRK